MRIVAGQWRGRTLERPQGMATRPTADRVRESLFSMLASRLGSFDGLVVADLYAGSGALALEALSRGAQRAVLVEQDARALAAIRANVAALGAAADVRALSAERLPRLERGFDLVFADPPYAEGSGSAAVAAVAAAGWLAPGGWLAVETERGQALDPGPYALDTERDIGRARIHLLRF